MFSINSLVIKTAVDLHMVGALSDQISASITFQILFVHCAVLSLSWPESLTTIEWGLSPIVRRPQEETGAGPAALSGLVRYPDRKQLEGCCSRWAQEAVERCELRPSHTETRPDIRLYMLLQLKDAESKCSRQYFMWSRQLFADEVCGSVSSSLDLDLAYLSQRCRLKMRQQTVWSATSVYFS